MNVALAADRRRVAELLCDLLDGGDDVALRLGLAIVFLELRQSERRQDRPGPGPEILGREILSGDAADVGVDIAGIDGVRSPIVIQVLKEFVTRNVRAALRDRGDALVLDPQFPLLA